MRAPTRYRRSVALALGAVCLVGGAALGQVAPPDGDAGTLAPPPTAGKWDAKAQEILPQCIEKSLTLGSAAQYLSQASCLIDIKFITNQSPVPLAARLSYGFEDTNDDGLLTDDELSLRTVWVSSPLIGPYITTLRRGLSQEAVQRPGMLLRMNHIKLVSEGPDGYQFELKPAADAELKGSLSYSVAHIDVSKDFRITEIRAVGDDGSQTTRQFKHVEIGGKWADAGYTSRTQRGRVVTKESRRNTYQTVQEIPVFKQVVVDVVVATMMGTTRTRQEYTFSNWRIKKRPEPLPAVALAPTEPPAPPAPPPPEEKGAPQPPAPAPKGEEGGLFDDEPPPPPPEEKGAPQPPAPPAPKGEEGGLFDDEPPPPPPKEKGAPQPPAPAPKGEEGGLFDDEPPPPPPKEKGPPQPPAPAGLAPGLDPRRTSDDPTYGTTKTNPVLIYVAHESVPAGTDDERVDAALRLLAQDATRYVEALRDARGRPFTWKAQEIESLPGGHLLLPVRVTDAEGATRVLYLRSEFVDTEAEAARARARRLAPKGMYFAD